MRSDGGAEACELVRGVAYRELVEAARPHRTEASFRSSAFFRAHGAALEQLLVTPRVDAPGEDGFGAGAGNAAVRASRMAAGRTTAPDAVSLRVLQWNIEKGKQLAGILRHLDDDPWMRRADLILLNEVDCGTARGGNVDQARCIAGALGMHCAWLPTFVECTKGTGSDLDAPGENTRGLHGLAILSRWPILAARAATVPSCHDYFDFHEKRFGGRRGLYTLIAAGDLRLVAATTHLEVRRTPRCRAAQFGAFLLGLDESLAAWGREGLGRREKSDVPVILAGDWNTNTFRRGTLAWSAWEFLRLVTTPVETLSAQLVAPFAREPLFDLLAAERFAVRPCNDAVPTAAQDLGSVEDLAALPASLARGVARAFRLSGRVLRMRLDWIAVRGLQVRGRPVTLPAAGPDGHDLSDHAAIGVDLEAR